MKIKCIWKWRIAGIRNEFIPIESIYKETKRLFRFFLRNCKKHLNYIHFFLNKEIMIMVFLALPTSHSPYCDGENRFQVIHWKSHQIRTSADISGRKDILFLRRMPLRWSKNRYRQNANSWNNSDTICR